MRVEPLTSVPVLTSGQAEVPHSLPLEPDSPLSQNPKREATGELIATCTAPLVRVLCLATSPPLESQQPDATCLCLVGAELGASQRLPSNSWAEAESGRARQAPVGMPQTSGRGRPSSPLRAAGIID